jgi:chromosome segregation ATPase
MSVFGILALAATNTWASPTKSRFLALVAESSAGLSKNPVSKVCTMLEGLSSEIETDKKMEQDLFDKYECWYKAVISAKKGGISEAEETIGALNSYIDDIESGRIEFSTEGADATKDVAELSDEIEKAAALRKKEKEDFEAAQEELQASITALKKAEKEMKEGAPVELLSSSKMLRMGQAVLSAADAKLLEQAMAADPKSPDYKKLNKEKKFNKKFKVRSGKIQELITDMRIAFQDNLAQAEQKEADTVTSYEKLKSAKDSQLSAAKDALAALGGETASREEAVAEARGEITDIEEQISRDKGFMKDTEDAYKEKLGQWKERKKLMSQEILAIGKALTILRSDEARDTMSKTYDKKIGLTQIAVKTTTFRQQAAVSALERAALHSSTHSSKLQFLALMLKEDPDPDRFKKVFKSLNQVKKDLNAESKADLEKKEECNTQLTTKTDEVQTSANFIDEKSRFINRTEFEVSALYEGINKTVEEIEQEEWDLDDATKKRDEANAAFIQEKDSLTAAIDFIKKAIKELENYYDTHGFSLLATKPGTVKKVPALKEVVKHTASLVVAKAKVHSGQPTDPMTMTVEAGKAPPPPPATITTPYKGNDKGIQGIMAEVQADVEKDKADLEKDEDKAQKAFDKMKDEVHALIETKMKIKADKEKQIANKLDDISTATEVKLGEKDTLDATVASLKAIEPDCNYVTTTFDLRIENRKEEADGADEAIKALDGDVKEVEYKEASASGK